MMNGVRFGTYHSYEDMSLVLNSKVIGEAPIKEKTVDIEGGHGVLDYTEFFGEAKYGRRTLVFNFQSIVPQKRFPELYSEVQNALHGKKMNIILDEDTDFYYRGRLSVGDWTKDLNVGAVIITADCDPWKYKKDITRVLRTVSGAAQIILPNLRMRTVPTITTSAEMSFVYKGSSVTAGPGTFTIPVLELTAGNNPVSVSGNGTVSFEYQEGGL